MRIALFAALASLAAISAARAYEEQPVVLKDAPGRDVVMASCSGCHSVDYIRMNSPFLTAEGWKAEVGKMRAAFAAPVDDAAAATVLQYLAANYSAPGP